MSGLIIFPAIRRGISYFLSLSTGLRLFFSASLLILLSTLLYIGKGVAIKINPGDSTQLKIDSPNFIQDAWFSPSGDLLSVEKASPGNEVFLRKWTQARGGWENSITYPINQAGNIPYAISRDGTHFAIYSEGKIYLGKVDSQTFGKSISLPTTHSEAKYLSFYGDGNDILSVLYENYKVKFYNTAALRKEDFGTVAPCSCPLNSDKDHIVASDFNLGDLICMTMADENGESYAKTLEIPPNYGSSLAALDCKHLAIGTTEGNVIFTEGNTIDKKTVPIYSGKSVNALSFSVDGGLFVGGNFRHIYYIEEGEKNPFYEASGVRLLATTEKHVAYVGREFSVVEIDHHLEIDESVNVFIALFGTVLSIVGLLISIVQMKK